MPYQTIAELPSTVRDTYTDSQQQAFLSAFNAALSSGGDEAGAFAIAHDAAQGVKSHWFKSIGEMWIGYYTNAYKDRDGEYFPEDEIQRDIDRMNSTGDYPTLQYFHIPWAILGKAHAAMKLGRFGVVMGVWDKNPLAQAVKADSEAYPEKYGMSFGFEFLEEHKRENAFYGFKTFEVSILPIEAAANSFTQFIAKAVKQQQKGFDMNPNGMDEQRVRKFLAEMGVQNSDAVIQALQAGAKEATLAADEATQRDYKETMGEAIEAEGQDDINEIGIEPPMRAYIDKRLSEVERKMGDMVKSVMSDYEAKMQGMLQPQTDELRKSFQALQAQSMQGARAANLLQEQQENAESMNAYKQLQEQGLDGGFAEFLLGQRLGAK